MKKKTALMLCAALLICLLAGCGNSGETVAVENVGDIVRGGSIGYVDRYAGIVSSGETADIKNDPDKEILTVCVAVGDFVKQGDVIFEYDTDAMGLKLQKLELEYDTMQTTIASAQAEIPNLEEKIKTATPTDQLAYSLQIQSLQADILESTYNMALKEREIAAMKEAIANSQVFAPISGRVMAVNEPTGAQSGQQPAINAGTGTGTGSDAFITITDVHALRVKGVINEMNVGTLSEGIPVLIRSRIDSSVTWTGRVEKIDWENPVTDSGSSMYYVQTDEMSSSTKYPFYVTLDSMDGMLLGQHVYIEPDYGQSSEKGGLWLPAGYIAYEDDGSAFVWAQNGRGRLEKRSVELGETDPDVGTVEILSGITEDDMIAFPEDGLSAGMTCVPYSETMFISDEDGAAEAPVMAGGVG